MDAKEALKQAVSSLTDEQAKVALDFIETLQRQALYDQIRKDLGPGSAIEVPMHPPKRRHFEPIECTGIPASKLLINDRR